MKVRARIRNPAQWLSAVLPALGLACAEGADTQPNRPGTPVNIVDRQITNSRSGHILTNIGVWSPDAQWIVYDTRSTPAGDQFDGETIEVVNVRNGDVRVVFRAQHAAHCGVATFHPRDNKVIFIQGPENPTPDWQYSPWHRQGIVVDLAHPQHAFNLDACDVSPPFTPGALRGGSHVHVWDPAGEWVSFTYEDHVLSTFQRETTDHEINLRNVGVSAPLATVTVNKNHLRNHDGQFFSVLVTRTVANPRPGSDDINKAFEEGWIGINGYVRADGTRQKHALAFQGQVLTDKGELISEVFLVDLPDDLRVPGDGPLAGTQTRRPFPPKGTVQKRLTYTSMRAFPGLQGPRHWLRSSPDGSKIAFLMKDEAGLAQLWMVSPLGGPVVQLTHNPYPIASAFTWSPDGRYIAHVMDKCVCMTETTTGQTKRLTEPGTDETAPRPEACVFAPEGKQIAYVRPVRISEALFNQIFVVASEEQNLSR